MASFGTYLKDMSECIDARLLGASASFGSYALGVAALAPIPAPDDAGRVLASVPPLAALIGLALCFALSRRKHDFPQRVWLWAASGALAVCALTLFVAQDSTIKSVSSSLAWLSLSFCLSALVQRFASLPLRRRIAMSATSVICSLVGLIALALLGTPVSFAVMAALPLAATACLPQSSELTGYITAEKAEGFNPVCFSPSFLATVLAYSTIATISGSVTASNMQHVDLPVCSSALSIACIILLSLHKGRKGFVEDSNSAYKPAPLLIAIGLLLIASSLDPLVLWGAAFATAGFSVFFVYYWIVIGNHIQKLSWSGIQAAAWSLGPLFVGIFAGRLLSDFLTTTTENPFQSTAIIGLFLLSIVLWIVTKGDLFANEPDDDGSNVFKLEPPKTASLAHEDETALEAFAQRYGISKREQDVVRLLSKGRNVPFICDELFIAKSTVQTHIKHIYAKTGATNRQELLDVIEEASI